MTANIDHINIDEDSWLDLINKSNQTISYINENAVGVGSNAAIGIARVEGSYSSNNVYTYNIYGGTPENPDKITIASPTNIISNTTFSNDITDLGIASNVTISGANSTHFYLKTNPVTNKLEFGTSRLDETLQDVEVKNAANNQVITYSTSSKKWSNLDINNLDINPTKLDGYAATNYPRKEENANITGKYSFANPINIKGTVDNNITETTSNKITLVVNTSKMIDSFKASDKGNLAKYLINVRDSSNNVQVSEILMMALNDDVQVTEYAQLFSNSSFCEISANVSANTINVFATSSANSTISFYKTYVKV